MIARQARKGQAIFIGHYSAAFAAAALPKAPRLGVLFITAQLSDFAFFIFIPLGIESMRIAPGLSVMNPMDLHDMPWTHSLAGAFVWSSAFAVLLGIATRCTKTALIGGAVVLSHWFLDLLVHVPDLTLAGHPPKLGFGLWNYPAIAMPIELGLLGLGIAIYVRACPAQPKSRALLVLVSFMLVVQAINWFGPPPVVVDAGVWGLGLFVFTLAAILAAWVARTRVHR